MQAQYIAMAAPPPMQTPYIAMAPPPPMQASFVATGPSPSQSVEQPAVIVINTPPSGANRWGNAGAASSGGGGTPPPPPWPPEPDEPRCIEVVEDPPVVTNHSPETEAVVTSGIEQRLSNIERHLAAVESKLDRLLLLVQNQGVLEA
jgi:hypothetical protein